LYKLAPDQILTAKEVAAVIRRSLSTLDSWRQHNPNHPLKWEKLDGRIAYRVRNVRAYLAS
jgi:hypothetical protein